MTLAASNVEGAAPRAERGGYWWIVLRRLRRRREAWVALWVLVALAAVAVFADVVAPYEADDTFLAAPSGQASDPLAPRATGKYEGPSLEHPFGTDQLARDVLSRTIFGLRISLGAAVVAIVVATAVGASVGTLAALGPRLLGALLMRATDVAYAFPALLLVILVGATLRGTALARWSVLGLGADVLVVFIAIALTAWPTMARLVRGQLLVARQLDHVLAARALGASPLRVALRHMLPTAVPVMLVEATFLVPRAIAAEAALSFIGIGATPPTPSLGVLAADHFAFVGVQWSALAISTGVLVLLFLVFQLLGEGLQYALDPRREA